MLDLRDLVDMLEGDCTTDLVPRVHRPAQAILSRLDIGGVQEEIGGGWSAEVEGE